MVQRFVEPRDHGAPLRLLTHSGHVGDVQRGGTACGLYLGNCSHGCLLSTGIGDNTPRQMAGRFEDRGWLARVSSPSGIVKGAAWTIDGEHLVTCAHVVLDAGADGPGGKVWVDYPLLGTGCEAVVLEEGWAPVAEEGGMAGDLALLRLTEQPAGLEALPLRSLRSLDGLHFSAYGFPEGYDSSLDTEGRLRKAVGLERVQLEVHSALLVQPGFSGAAVWSDKLGAVVGMLTSRHWGTEGAVAFAVPMRTIAMRSPVVAAALQTPLDLDRDRATHWGPRSRGVSMDRDDAGWLFSGRDQALRELAAWLADGRPPALRVVTGTPGSGKSAVLARLVTSADGHYRSRIPGLRPDDPTLPPAGVFNVTFHASGRTLREFIDHVAALAEVAADSASTLLGALGQQDSRLVIAVDAVDEASEPRDLAWLLCDLAARGNRTLVGCRPHLVDQLGDPEPIRLDQPPYLDQRDAEIYVSRLLSGSGAAADGLNTEALAGDVATAAQGNFLVAQLTAQAVAASGRVERPFPHSVSQAFERLLTALPDADKARDLLLPLALAFGDGLPAELWLTGAEALRRRYEPGDLDDLLSSPAASFLITRLDATGGRRHRLFHQALSETLTRGRDLTVDHKRLLDAWTSSLPETADGKHRWADAAPYLRAHVAEHAASAGQLGELSADTGYLLAGDLHRLLVSLVQHQPANAESTALLRLVAARAQPLSARARGFLLGLAACHLGLPEFASRIQDDAMAPWRARWAHSLGQPHQLLTGHTRQVFAVALGRVGERDVVASAGDSVRLWDAASGEQLMKPLTGHTRGALTVAMGRIGSRAVVVSGGVDGTVRVWDAATGNQLAQPLTGHADPVFAVALGRVGEREVIASGGADRTVRMWDAASGEQLGEPLTGHRKRVFAVALGRVGKRDVLASGGEDGAVLLWDAVTRAELRELPTGNIYLVTAVALGTVGERDVIVAAGEAGMVWVWDATTGERLSQRLIGHRGRVFAVALGWLGGRGAIASGGQDGTVRLWDATTGEQIGQPLIGHTGAVLGVALGRVGEREVIASAGFDQTVRLWEPTSGEPLGGPLTGHTDRVNAVSSRPLGLQEVIASAGDDQTVRLWDATSGEQLGRSLTGHTERVRAVAFGCVGDRQIVLSAGEDRTLRRWDAVSGEQLGPPLVGHTAVVFSVAVGRIGDQDIIVSAGESVRLWDATSGRQLGEPLTGHRGRVFAVALGRVGERYVIATGGWDKTVRLWDAATSEQLGRPMTGHTERVFAVALCRVAERDAVVSAGRDRIVRLWDAISGEPLGQPLVGHSRSVNAVSVTRFGDRAVIASASDDRSVRIWDAQTHKAIHTLDTLDRVTAIALAPPSRLYIASGPAICCITPDTEADGRE